PRLADRLGGDDPDRVADLGERAGGHRPAVAGLAHAAGGLALQHRAHRHLHRVALLALVAEGLGDLTQLLAADFGALLGQHATALGRDRLRSDAPDEPLVGLAVVLVDIQFDELLRAAVGLADDHVLGDVHQAAGQVAR